MDSLDPFLLYDELELGNTKEDSLVNEQSNFRDWYREFIQLPHDTLASFHMGPIELTHIHIDSLTLHAEPNQPLRQEVNFTGQLDNHIPRMSFHSELTYQGWYIPLTPTPYPPTALYQSRSEALQDRQFWDDYLLTPHPARSVVEEIVNRQRYLWFTPVMDAITQPADPHAIPSFPEEDHDSIVSEMNRLLYQGTQPTPPPPDDYLQLAQTLQVDGLTPLQVAQELYNQDMQQVRQYYEGEVHGMMHQGQPDDFDGLHSVIATRTAPHNPHTHNCQGLDESRLVFPLTPRTILKACHVDLLCRHCGRMCKDDEEDNVQRWVSAYIRLCPMCSERFYLYIRNEIFRPEPSRLLIRFHEFHTQYYTIYRSNYNGPVNPIQEKSPYLPCLFLTDHFKTVIHDYVVHL